MKALRAVNDLVQNAFLAVVTILFATYIVVVFMQVIARNYLGFSFLWADEVARMCFVWSVFLGAAVAVRWQWHYVVEVVPESWRRASQGLRLFGTLASLWVVYVLIVGGVSFTQLGLTRFSESLEIPRAWVFAAMPVSGIAMLLFSIELVLDNLRALAGRG